MNNFQPESPDSHLDEVVQIDTSDLPLNNTDVQRRKAIMLAELKREMRNHVLVKNRWRRAQQVSTGAVVLLLLGLVLFWISQDQSERSHDQATFQSPQQRVEVPTDGEPQSKRQTINDIENGTVDGQVDDANSFVVSNKDYDLESLKLETIGDQEMLRLLEDAGIQGWIAEIGEKRVVITSEGEISY